MTGAKNDEKSAGTESGPKAATPLDGTELTKADGIRGDEKRSAKGEVDQGVGNRMWAAGGAGEIETGRVIHRADVPDGGEESFERLACAAQGAETEGESGEKKCAGGPGKEAGETRSEQKSNARTRAGKGGNRQTGKKTGEQLARENV